MLQSLESWLKAHHGQWMHPTFNPRMPFHCLRPDWKKRFLLRDDLLPWVKSELGLDSLYPDELSANTRPVTLVRALLHKGVGNDALIKVNDSRPSSAPLHEPTIFVLGCPRSGTTLLRTMLMGHPEIFAGPELYLIQYHSMLQRERLITDSGAYWKTMGLAQTIQMMRGWTITRAFQYVTHITKSDFPIIDVYKLLHDWNNKKFLVDKSPSTTFNMQTLEKIEQWFNDPFYIHIVRHPVPVVQSMMRMQINPPQTNHTAESAQFRWRNDNSNALHHLALIPVERQFHLRYEDLVQDPKQQLSGICNMLKIHYSESMENPYKGERMIEGIGCVNLPKRSKVEKSLADDWKLRPHGFELEPATIELAERLNYAL